LLDGTTHNKHLFLLTSNNSDIGKYFNNRPGRVRYHKRFEEFSEIALHQMIDDKVFSATLNKELHKYVETSGSISPDAISCLIEECLIHNETPDKFKDIINIQSIDDNAYSAVVTLAKVTLLPDLNKESKEKGLQYLAYSEGNYTRKQYVLEQNPDIETYAQYTTTKTIDYISSFCRPFSDYSYDQEICINYAYCEETSERDSFCIKEIDILEMKKSKGAIYIKTKKLEVKLTKTKPLNIFAY
jgi:hypothetical protein